eukprot:m.183651 g.183651  ORF g.183651 m.183651 type:complete len:1765 (-) comp17477_c2_seq2:663-5957(-)
MQPQQRYFRSAVLALALALSLLVGTASSITTTTTVVTTTSTTTKAATTTTITAAANSNTTTTTTKAPTTTSTTLKAPTTVAGNTTTTTSPIACCASLSAACSASLACAGAQAAYANLANCDASCLQVIAPVFAADRLLFFRWIGCLEQTCFAMPAIRDCYGSVVACKATGTTCSLMMDTYLATYRNCSGQCITNIVNASGVTDATALRRFRDVAYCVERGLGLNNASNCNNRVKDSNEQGLDCGGSCGACSCSNGVQDGNETGVDCGGPDCFDCAVVIPIYQLAGNSTSYPSYPYPINLGDRITFVSWVPATAGTVSVATGTCFSRHLRLTFGGDIGMSTARTLTLQSAGAYNFTVTVGNASFGLNLAVAELSNGACPDTMTSLGCRARSETECARLGGTSCTLTSGCILSGVCVANTSNFLSNASACAILQPPCTSLGPLCALSSVCTSRSACASITGGKQACETSQCIWAGCATKNCSAAVADATFLEGTCAAETNTSSSTAVACSANPALAVGCYVSPTSATCESSSPSNVVVTADDFCYDQCLDQMTPCLQDPACNASISAMYLAVDKQMQNCDYFCQLGFAPDRFANRTARALFFRAVHCVYPCFVNLTSCNPSERCPDTFTLCTKTPTCLPLYSCLDNCGYSEDCPADCRRVATAYAQQVERALRHCVTSRCFNCGASTSANGVEIGGVNVGLLPTLSMDFEYMVAFNVTMEGNALSDLQRLFNSKKLNTTGENKVLLRGAQSFTDDARGTQSISSLFGPFRVLGRVNGTKHIVQKVDLDITFNAYKQVTYCLPPARGLLITACDAVCKAPVNACMNDSVCKLAGDAFTAHLDATVYGDISICDATCIVQGGPDIASNLPGHLAFWDAVGCYMNCIPQAEQGVAYTYSQCGTACAREYAVCSTSRNCSMAMSAASIGTAATATTTTIAGGGETTVLTNNPLAAFNLSSLSALDRARFDAVSTCYQPSVQCPPNVFAADDGRRVLNVSLKFTSVSNIGWASAALVDDKGALLMNETAPANGCSSRQSFRYQLQMQLPAQGNLTYTMTDTRGVAISCTVLISANLSQTASGMRDALGRMQQQNLTTTEGRNLAGEVMRNQTQALNFTSIDPASLEYLFDSLSLMRGLIRNPADGQQPFVNNTFSTLDQFVRANKTAVVTAGLPQGAREFIRDFALDLANAINGTAGRERREGSSLIIESVKLDAPAPVNFTGSNDTSFSVPPGAFANCSNSSSLQIVFTTMTDTTLLESNATVASVVVSASLPNCNTNLTGTSDLFVFSLRVDPPLSPEIAKCSFFDEDAGEWSTAGLSRVSIVLNAAGLVVSMTCGSPHLTNFAVLVDASGASASGVHGKALSIITLVCASISIVGLVLTILTHTAFKRLRTSIPSHLLLCLSSALLVALALFIVASEVVTGNEVLCQSTAVLLQYFWLCAMAWMVVESVNLYAVTVIVLGLNMERRIKVYHLFGWGFPAVVTAVTLGVAGIDDYGDSSFCWINDRKTLIGGFLIPLGAMVCINVVGFALVFAAVHRTRKRRQQRRSHKDDDQDFEEKKREIRAAVSLFFLLGVAWVFGALIDTGDGSSSLAFQYIFAITVSLQGFFIFVFHCLGNPHAMEEYRRSFSGSGDSRKSFSNLHSSSSSNDAKSKSKPAKESSTSQSYVLSSAFPKDAVAANSKSSNSKTNKVTPVSDASSMSQSQSQASQTGERSQQHRRSEKDWVRTDSFKFQSYSHMEESSTTPHSSFDLNANPNLISLDWMDGSKSKW